MEPMLPVHGNFGIPLTAEAVGYKQEYDYYIVYHIANCNISSDDKWKCSF
jgi:hypothetical protein